MTGIDPDPTRDRNFADAHRALDDMERLLAELGAAVSDARSAIAERSHDGDQ